MAGELLRKAVLNEKKKAVQLRALKLSDPSGRRSKEAQYKKEMERMPAHPLDSSPVASSTEIRLSRGSDTLRRDQMLRTHVLSITVSPYQSMQRWEGGILRVQESVCTHPKQVARQVAS